MATANTKRNESKDYSDLYNTPVPALDALCEKVDFDKTLMYFEPCNGIGAISSYFKEKLGIDMITNELNDYAEADYKEDFLNPCNLAKECWDFDCIVSNPPYKKAKEFVIEGFKYATRQYQLLRINFLEGQVRKKELFDLKQLRRVFIFSYRISCSKGTTEEKQPNAVAYAWFEFDRDYEGNPEIEWL